MTKSDKNQKNEYWKQLVEAQQISGLSQREFCKQNDLVLSQFVYYRCQQRSGLLAKESSFTPVKGSRSSMRMVERLP